MSNWLVALLVLNAAPMSIVDSDTLPSPPLWSPTQMTRAEWRVLLDAFDAARGAYVRELIAWRNEQPREPGALTRAAHELDVAKRRLTRFELDVSVGRNDGPRQRVTYLRRLTPN